MANIRGAAILGTIEYARTTFGDESLAKVRAAVQAETLALLGEGADGGRVLADGWYDTRLLVDLSREIDRVCGSGDLSLVRAAGRYCAFQDVNRFFKWLLRIAGPSTLFQRAASVFRSYHDSGIYVVEHAGPGRAAIRLEDWRGADPVMCKRIEGWIERALELTLGADKRPHIHETGHCARDASLSAHTFCRFVADWS